MTSQTALTVLSGPASPLSDSQECPGHKLPRAARIYVATVIAVGAILLVVFFPIRLRSNPALFVILLLLSLADVRLQGEPAAPRAARRCRCRTPWTSRRCCCSAPHETMLVAVVSAWSQCTFRMQEQEPALPDAVQHGVSRHHACRPPASVYTLLGGVPGR